MNISLPPFDPSHQVSQPRELSPFEQFEAKVIVGGGLVLIGVMVFVAFLAAAHVI